MFIIFYKATVFSFIRMELFLLRIGNIIMRIISYIFTFILFLSSFSCLAGDTTNIPLSRRLFHDNIKAEQKRLDKEDGKLDGFIRLSGIEDVNLQVTDAMIRKINVLRNFIELDSSLATNNDKIRYLRYIENLVKNFTNSWKAHKVNPTLAPLLVDNFTSILHANLKGESMAPFISEVPYEVGVINSNIFKENQGYKESQKYLFLKYSELHPETILEKIGPYVDEPYADTLVVIAFQNNLIKVYDYAQSIHSLQGKLIRRNTDSRIKMLVQLSNMDSALFYFPFLDNLISGKQTIEGISKYLTVGKAYDSVGYYKLLVNTQIEYYKRLTDPVKPDTPIAMFGVNGLTDMLQNKAIQHFITPINELHEVANPAVRFRALDHLNPRDLYYMMVLGENEIFTSSYKNSFDLMLKRMGPKPRGDSLLMSVGFDHFKKFIKMAAGYNKLDTFLRTIPSQRSDKLMMGFISNLETSNTLEDADDVADSYGSITNQNLLKSMLQNVSDNEQRCLQDNNPRGQKIYHLLKLIFLSADSTNKIDLSKELGIPPVYTVDNNYLSNDSGKIIEQVFFYGDKDGKESYESYMSSFPKTEWKVSKNKEWTEIKSLKGKSIWIYANNPLDNETDKDATAQKNLIDYLDENNLRPTIVIHRGHSYHLKYTIQQMPESARIIMLGSCGGYNNLKQILDYAPDAHIISTKQIGARDVNKPIIEAINNTLRAGKNIDWRHMWNGLDALFSKGPREKRDLFDDYIPPHKNLGALMIKAYTKTNTQ